MKKRYVVRERDYFARKWTKMNRSQLISNPVEIFNTVRLRLQRGVNFAGIVLFPSDTGPDRDINWIINLHRFRRPLDAAPSPPRNCIYPARWPDAQKSRPLDAKVCSFAKCTWMFAACIVCTARRYFESVSPAETLLVNDTPIVKLRPDVLVHQRLLLVFLACHHPYFLPLRLLLHSLNVIVYVRASCIQEHRHVESSSL